MINTVKGTPGRTISITRSIYPIHAVRSHQSCLPQDSGFNRKFLHGPNRKVPSYIHQGNKYIPVAYHYDSNTIHAEPLKTCSGLYLKTDYQKLHSLLTNRGFKHVLHILDNECPNVLKNFMKEVNEKFQLVPAHIHCRKSAERVIQTFKEHFIAGLASNHKDFPVHLWCQLLPHASLTLNLLRQSRMNPKLSGYANLMGNLTTTPRH